MRTRRGFPALARGGPMSRYARERLERRRLPLATAAASSLPRVVDGGPGRPRSPLDQGSGEFLPAGLR